MTLTSTGHPRERRFVSSKGRQPGIRTALALCLLLIALAACQPAVQQLDLVGVWTDRTTYMQFDKEGLWIGADTFELLSVRQLAHGTYHLEGTLLTFETDEESRECRGKTATYEVELSEQEELTFTLVGEDACAGRKADLLRGPFERYSP